MELSLLYKPLSRVRLALTLSISSLLIYIVWATLGTLHSYWFYLFSLAIVIIFVSVPIIFKLLIAEFKSNGKITHFFVLLICLALGGILSMASAQILSRSENETNILWYNGYLYYGTRTLKPLEERGYSLYKCYGYGFYCEGLSVGSVKDPNRKVSIKLQFDETANSLEFLADEEIIYRLNHDKGIN